MAAIVSRKRGIDEIQAIDPSSLNLQIFCSVRNSEDANGLKKVYAVAQISTSGGIRCDIVKRVGKEQISSIAKLEACLIERRGHGAFHEICDAESQEVADVGIALFDIDGRMEAPLRDVVSRPEDCDHGSLFYLTSVTVDKKVQGKNIGLLLTHAVMKALRDKWTLALTFPAPLYFDRSPDAKPDAFQTAVAKVSRYFARIGFVQVCGERPHELNKYWALERSKLGDVISITKAESANIVVQADAKPVKMDEINTELRELLLSLKTYGSVMGQESKNALEKQAEQFATILKEGEDSLAESLQLREEMKAKCDNTCETLIAMKAQLVTEINATSSSEIDADDRARILQATNDITATIDENIEKTRTTWASAERALDERTTSIQGRIDTCRDALASMDNSADSPRMQQFRTAMSDVIRRGGDVNEAKVLHNAVANNLGTSVIEMMVNEYGAEVNRQDSSGCTCLHLALCVPDLDGDTIKTLLKLGADKNIVDKEGKTPLQTGRDHKKRTKKLYHSMGIADHPSIPGRLDVIDRCIDLLS